MRNQTKDFHAIKYEQQIKCARPHTIYAVIIYHNPIYIYIYIYIYMYMYIKYVCIYRVYAFIYIYIYREREREREREEVTLARGKAQRRSHSLRGD
jgi:hypothetical protein